MHQHAAQANPTASVLLIAARRAEQQFIFLTQVGCADYIRLQYNASPAS